MNYTLKELLEVQKKVDAGITHDGKYMPWLAGVCEIIEMCEHLTLISTWKHQEKPDMKQAFMELVDIFAFAMSNLNSYGEVDFELNNNEFYVVDDYTFVEQKLRELINGFTEIGSVKPFYRIRDIANSVFKVDIEKVYYYYMGKQELTKFRQKNGYKTGDYQKVWAGMEDNEHLTAMLEQGIEIDAIPKALAGGYGVAISHA